MTAMDQGFLVLAAAAAVLTACTLAFAVLALLLRIGNDRTAERRARLRRRWEPAMLEVLGGNAPPEAIFERVEEGDGTDFLEFLLGYARRLRGDEQTLIREMAAPYLPHVVPRLREGTAETRGHAVLILARLGLPIYADAVAEALRDPSPVVSMVAAHSLLRPEHEQHFPAVLEQLPRFTSWSRTFLAGMLAGGGARAAPLLREILRDADRSSLVRAVAADALRELNDLPSVALAHDLVREPGDHGAPPSDGDLEMVVSCLRILARLGHHEHLTAVRVRAGSADPVIRAAAVSALGALGGKAEVPVLRARLDDPSFWVSLEAARGLLALGERALLERIAATGGPWSLRARQVLAE